MESFQQVLSAISGFLWGVPLMVALVGTGIFLTLKSKGIQFKGFLHGIALITGKYDKKDHKGETTHFQALSTALSATIGTGNIAGVATAIASGGPGAVVWMWITALFGMSIKYHSALLAQKFRKIGKNGVVSGGPMYFIDYGLKKKWLAVSFALFTAIASFGIGNMAQANSVAEPINAQFGVPKLVTGLIMAFLVGFVILGGIKRISNVASKLVPAMAILYVVASLVVIFMNIDKIGEAFRLIFYYAFNNVPKSATGGFAGATVWGVMRFGVARGLFSNEAGLGSAPIAHASAKTDKPVREGLVAMLGPFIDTIIICTMTALVIITSGVWDSGVSGATLTSNAFNVAFNGWGAYVVSISISIFAFTTLIGWSYYGDRSVEYLLGKKYVRIYQILFILIIPIGAIIKLKVVWTFSDIANALMALPNLIAVIMLSGVVAKMTKEYFSNKDNFKV